MIGEGVYARAYARALLGAAMELRDAEGVTQDMLALALQWQGSPELRAFCQRHLPGSPRQQAGLVAQVWGRTFTPTVILFLELLVQWGHLRLIPLITEQYQALADRAQGCHNVEAAFACEPRAEEVERVRQLAAEAYGPVLKLTVRVDPVLLAGVRIRINDKQVDASLAGRVARLKNALKKPMPLDAVAS
jgi:F-type H+-transporting ATPase subunit delta